MIAHAVMDENGGIGRDALEGDQTGKEICKRNFYNRTGGWHTVLRCKDRTMAQKAAKYIELIAENNKYGYSQPERWTGYKSIEGYINDGFTVEDAISQGKGSFDCSSLVISCYIFAGLKHSASGYTGSMVKTLYATGKFDKYTETKYTAEDTYAKVGDVYVGNGHTAMNISDGSEEEEDMKPPYVAVTGSVVIREGAGTEYKKVMTAHKGDKYKFVALDENTGWYWIDTPKGRACISNFANKKRKYTELVKV